MCSPQHTSVLKLHIAATAEGGRIVAWNWGVPSAFHELNTSWTHAIHCPVSCDTLWHDFCDLRLGEKDCLWSLFCQSLLWLCTSMCNVYLWFYACLLMSNLPCTNPMCPVDPTAQCWCRCLWWTQGGPKIRQVLAPDRLGYLHSRKAPSTSCTGCSEFLFNSCYAV